ncbi:MAG TPA: DUF6443 domain-containing protein [Puia sp.]|jgi:RHS repeat-associated protein
MNRKIFLLIAPCLYAMLLLNPCFAQKDSTAKPKDTIPAPKTKSAVILKPNGLPGGGGGDGGGTGGGNSCTITGPVSVPAGSQQDYTLSCDSDPGSPVGWTITGGTQVFETNVTNGSVVTVQWANDGTTTTGSVSAIGVTKTTLITYPTFDAGTLSVNQTTINANTSPVLSISGTTGGVCNQYTYNWQVSTNGGSTYTTMASTTQTTYTPAALPGNATYYFRVQSLCGTSSTSNVVQVNVLPQLMAGIITPPSQFINYNTVPQMGVGIATGGDQLYDYHWFSDASGTWVEIGTGPAYAFGPLTANTHFKVVVFSNGAQAETVPATVNVYPPLVTGTIDPPAQSIAYGAVPGQMSVVNTTGGSLSYLFQWFSDASGTFQPVATGPVYTPGPLTATTHYYVSTTSNGSDPVLTSTATITVGDGLTVGRITPANITIAPGTSPGNLNCTKAFGGSCDGVYRYRWQSLNSDGTWSYLGDNMLLTYSPGILNSSMSYRLEVTCGSIVAYSDPCRVTVGTVSTDLNYIRTRLISKAGVVDKGSADVLADPADVQQTTVYFDGLGRSVQTVSKQVTPSGKDLVVPQVYDAFGREATHYLPYAAGTGDGNYKPGALSEQNAFNSCQFPEDQFFYGQINFESSPLNRPATAYSPGSNWVGAGKGVTAGYFVNTLDDKVQMWNIAVTPGSLPVSAGAYPAGQLLRNGTIDEQQHSTIIYKDNEGHVLLKKVQLAENPGADNTGWLCTYYVYDDLDNLRYVISPKAVEWLAINNWSFGASGGDQVASGLCFRYEYDGRGRMVVKQVPGAGEVDMVYDTRDRLVFTQDAVQRPNGQWISMQYDPFNRMVIEALMTYPYTRDGMQQSVTSQTSPAGSSSLPGELHLGPQDGTGDHVATSEIFLEEGFLTPDEASFSAAIVPPGYTDPGYTSNGRMLVLNPIPSGATILPLVINYYDNYDWVAGTGSGLGSSMGTSHTRDPNYFITADNASPAYAVAVNADPTSQGLLTGTMHLVLGENRPLYAVNFYDDRARQIQSNSVNYTGGVDNITTQYDFSGKLLRNLLTHNKLGNTPQSHTVLTKLDYDAAFRLKNIWKNIDGAATDQLVSNMQYNELGQLLTKNLGTELESIENEYNLRGWLTGINKSYLAGTSSHYFGMELAYDKNTSATGSTSFTNTIFNGNIAGIVWKSAGDGVNRKYEFSYDNANRLAGASFTQQFDGGWGTSDPNGSGAAMDFSVSNLSYDANGNIKAMKQNGWKLGAPTNPIDDLCYTYQTNSNQLLQVIDHANDPDSKLGDFHVKGTPQTVGYTYDANGNMISDNNKGITGISYNYMNLPELLNVSGKGTIRYTYDAAGNKLKKQTIDNLSNQATTTLYLGSFQYQRQSPSATPDAGDDVLQQVGHEEGRARWAFHKDANNQPYYGWEYDFFEKDHLGNTRVILTQEKSTTSYMATMEDAYRTTEKMLFFGVDTSLADRASVGFPDDVSVTNPNNKVTVLNGSGIKQGPAIILKVMSGDKVALMTQYYYNDAGGDHSGTIQPTGVLGSLAGGLWNITTGTHGAYSDLSNSTTSPLLGALSSFLTDPSVPDDQSKPKAYLNYVLLDNQFRYVGKCNQSGALQVQNSGTNNGQLWTPLATSVDIKTSGYLYIYLSNATEHQDVFFDNLSVVHTAGPMLEENHYYPFGLAMAGISDKALKRNYVENKYRYNGGNELQNKEFSDGSGLEMYDAVNRMYDPQLGRFGQIDPLADLGTEQWSPYAFALDNPILLNDPIGLSADSTCQGCMAPAVVTAVKPGCKTCNGPSVDAGPAPSNVAAPINKTNASSTAAAGLTIGVLGEETAGGITIVGGGAVAEAFPPLLLVGGLLYYGMSIHSTAPPPDYHTVGDIAIGIPKVITPSIPQTKTATLPTFTHKVYEIGGWDLARMKWQTLKYGVASMAYDTYGGAGNRRPDSQLGYMRSRYPMLMIRQLTLAYFTDKPSAHLFETGMVGLYQARNGGASPPEQILPY